MHGDKVGIRQIRQIPNEKATGLNFAGGRCRINPVAEPQGSKDPNNRVLGPKYYNVDGIWALKPHYLGPWTLRQSKERCGLEHLATGLSSSEAVLGVSENDGYLLGVPIIRTIVLGGSILGSPYFGKLPYIPYSLFAEMP